MHCRSRRSRKRVGKAMQVNLAEYRSLLRMDFCAFAHRAFLELNPAAQFMSNWHLELMAHALDEFRLGAIQRLGIYMPPRHLKSHFASVALPAFWLGHNPSAQIVCISYGQDLAEKHSLDCRRLMMSP